MEVEAHFRELDAVCKTLVVLTVPEFRFCAAINPMSFCGIPCASLAALKVDFFHSML